MKTNYRQRNRTHRPKWQKGVIALLVFILVVYLLSFVRVPLVSMAIPLWQGENAAVRGLANTFSFFRTKDSLIKENIALKLRIETHEAERFAYADWQEKERNLLNLLGRQRELSGVVASVVARPPRSPYDVLVIDAGEADGILVGQTVRMPEGPALGYVVETELHSAKVRLFSSAGEETNGVFQESGTAVTLEGLGGGMFRFSLPRDIVVEPGDTVTSLGIEQYTLAEVGDVILRPTDSFKEVLAQGPANIFNIRFVMVTR